MFCASYTVLALAVILQVSAQIQGPPGVNKFKGTPTFSSTPGPDKEVCDKCHWTSPDGAYYDLSYLCDQEYSIYMERPRGGHLKFGICDDVPCEGYTNSQTCLYVHGNKPTSTGSEAEFELIDPHVPSVGVRVILNSGEICELTGKPRKTIIELECQTSLSLHSMKPSPSRAWEGEGSEICTYYIQFPSHLSCPSKADKYSLPAPKITSVSGCTDSVPRLSTSDCSPTSDTLITVHGLDFLFDGKPLGAVHVYVGDQPCDQPRVLDTWTLTCRLRPGTGEGHAVRMVFWPNLQPGGEPIFKEELYASNPYAMVSFKLLVDYKRHFDSFMDLGVGGLTKQIQELYQRAFASRSVPAGVLKELGIEHAKGILLYGPPGSGKTLLARTIAKILKTDQVRIVNAPEIMSKYLGESEKNLRSHFDEAEKAWLEHGEASDLFIIIVDEIDAICKPRGKSDSSAAAAAYDSVVNQLLTKMDGLKSLHNVLVIGLTNRKELIDPALLRPGRFEIQIEIGLPDEQGRWEILTIHTRAMQESGYLSPEVNIKELAQNTSQFSGAELAGLVRLAASYALDRKFGNNSKQRDPLYIEASDFQRALQNIQPYHSQRKEIILSEYLPQGFINCGQAHEMIVARIEQIITMLISNRYHRLESVLLYGPQGVGKSGIAAYIASSGKFDFVKVLNPKSLIRLSDDAKAEAVISAFEDAFRSHFAVLMLDDVHNLVGLVSIAGSVKASHILLSSLSTLLSSQPNPNSRVLVLGTMLAPDPLLDDFYTGTVGLQDMFKTHMYVPNLGVHGTLEVLKQLKINRPSGQMLLPPNFSISLKNLLKVSSCVEHRLKSPLSSHTLHVQDAMDLCLKLVPHIETVAVNL